MTTRSDSSEEGRQAQRKAAMAVLAHASSVEIAGQLEGLALPPHEDLREAENGLADGATGILPIATETAGAIFGLASYAGATTRLIGLTWGAEDLAAALGAETNRLVDGTYGHLAHPCGLEELAIGPECGRTHGYNESSLVSPRVSMPI